MTKRKSQDQSAHVIQEYLRFSASSLLISPDVDDLNRLKINSEDDLKPTIVAVIII